MIIEEIESVNQIRVDIYGDKDGYGRSNETEWGSSLGENSGYGNGRGVGYGFLTGGGSGSCGGVNSPEFD